MSYIVISDVHLGGKCNQTEFCEFLDWVHGLENQSKTCKDNEVLIKKPDKIILLGDILELWDPREGDRNYVIKDCMRTFTMLSGIACDKIYVVGNHDDSLGELDTVVDYEMLPNGTKFDIYNRHYPEKDEKTGSPIGLKVGNRSYFFVHGQQFDKEQAILAYVSNLIGQSWNPLGWFQDLFNITSTKKNWKINFVIFLGLLGGWYVLFPRLSFSITLIWAAFTGFFAISSIPGVVAKAQGKIYGLTKPIDKTAEQVIEDEYYKKSKDTIEADVVVFGHTHFASSYELKSDKGKKLFINTGCWTGKDLETDNKSPDDKIRYANTFVYIDEGGAYIMKWLGAGEIKCIKAFTEKRALTLAV